MMDHLINWLLTIFFLLWGSFLNVVAYRLVRSKSIVRPRSACPKCKKPIAWYDNIPVISWSLLLGKCRHCKRSISALYPLIELLTACALLALYLFIPLHYFFAYFIFFSALMVTIRSDFETMLISRCVTIYLAPLGLLLSACNLLPISLSESILGAIFGYLFLYSINAIFKYFRGIEGIGEGDFELLFFVGSFTGIIGCWFSVTLGSILGSLYGIIIIFLKQQNNKIDNANLIKIPFGPFLAIGAIVFVFAFQFFLA